MITREQVQELRKTDYQQMGIVNKDLLDAIDDLYKENDLLREYNNVWAKDAVRLNLENEKLRRVAEAAKGLSCGTDWNKGNHAIKHGYRQKLMEALAALEEEK